jgi:hypothetical protein
MWKTSNGFPQEKIVPQWVIFHILVRLAWEVINNDLSNIWCIYIYIMEKSIIMDLIYQS